MISTGYALLQSGGWSFGMFLVDAAYEKVFLEWVGENLLGMDHEITSKPPGAESFVPVKWRWGTERTFGVFNLSRRLDKDLERKHGRAQSWVLWHNCQMVLNRLA